MAIIAICDDKKEELALTVKAVELYNQMRPEENRLTIQLYNSSKELWFKIEGSHDTDIFLLDIDMPGMNGITLAEKIHQDQPKAAIIFLTSHLEYAPKGYHVGALRYVAKIRIKEDLPEALDAAIRYWREEKQDYIILKHNEGSERLFLSEIRYVERVARRLEIHMKDDNIITSSQGIKEFYDKLTSNRFVFINRGCFVNVEYIQKIMQTDIYIRSTTERLSVSRKCLQEVKMAMAQNWKP